MQLYVPNEEPSQSSRRQGTKTQKVRNILSHRIWIGIWVLCRLFPAVGSSVIVQSMPAGNLLELVIHHVQFLSSCWRDYLSDTLTPGSVHLHCHRLSRQAWSHISPLHLMFTVATVGNTVSGFSDPFINCHQASDSPFLPLKIGKNVNLPQ